MQNRKNNNRPAKKVADVAKEITKNKNQKKVEEVKKQVKSEIPVVKPKQTPKPKTKPQPKVKTVEKDKSSENINVKIVSEPVQSEIKTVISETPQIKIVQPTISKEVRENLEPVKVSEVVLPKQTECKDYELGKVELNCTNDCECADKVGYEFRKSGTEKVGFFKKLINKIKAYFN